MQFSGHVSEYSLAEIFNFVHQGDRTGVLTLSPDLSTSATSARDVYYIWFISGQINAVTTGLEGIDLLTRIQQRRSISADRLEPVANNIYQLQQPLGIHLKSLDLLDAGQIKLLFNSQTITPACRLFELKNRQFEFDPDRLPMNAELTGMSLPALEVGLLGLRLLKDWSGLSAKLPDPNSTIQRYSKQEPNFDLNRSELKLWKLADGKTTLAQLADKMSLSIDNIQQIAFRLLTFNAIREIATRSSQPLDINSLIPIATNETTNLPVPSSFLGSLRQFLSGKRDRSTAEEGR